MSSAKKWFTGIVVAVSMVYTFTERMEFMKPVVGWLNARIGGDRLIELLLGTLVLYLLLSNGEKDATVAAAPTAPEPAKDWLPAAPPPLKRTVNIVGKKGRIAWLSDEGVGLYEPEKNGKFKAIIAEFRNEPEGSSLKYWGDVRASIAYFDDHESEVADTGKALWLNEGLEVAFPGHITRKLVVALHAAKSDEWLTVDDSEGRTLSCNIRKAKIVLQDDREFVLAFTLDVDLSQGIVGSLTALRSTEKATT